MRLIKRMVVVAAAVAAITPVGSAIAANPAQQPAPPVHITMVNGPFDTKEVCNYVRSLKILLGAAVGPCEYHHPTGWWFWSSD